MLTSVLVFSIITIIGISYLVGAKMELNFFNIFAVCLVSSTCTVYFQVVLLALVAGVIIYSFRNYLNKYSFTIEKKNKEE